MSKRLYINTFFENKILKSEASEFELFFTKIMKTIHGTSFTQIKPYSTDGDRKNDGYFYLNGIYYQVYGPEDIKKTATLNYAISKLNEDFLELIEHQKKGDWQEIKEFIYVINDKKKGIPPRLAKKRDELYKSHSIPISFYTAEDIQMDFLKLDDQKKEFLLMVPIPDTIDYTIVSFVALSKAIEYITSLNPLTDSSLEKLVVPDFDEKIIFNNLNSKYTKLLSSSSIFYDTLDEYFENDNDDVSDTLREKFSALYGEAKNITDCPNQQFEYIYNHAINQRESNSQIQYSVLHLMAYYFSCCDIFEEPK